MILTMESSKRDNFNYIYNFFFNLKNREENIAKS